jgi:hypothetical protein
VIRARMGRWGTSVAITVLLVSQGLVGTVAAADTRLIYVGSGPVGPATNGVLTLTPVSVGGTSVTNVIVKNIDNQTLTHVILTFQAPVSGLTLSGWYGTNAGSCAPVGTDPLVCDFGNLAKNATRTLSVLYQGTSIAASAAIGATVTFNETKPNGGANTHREPIGGQVEVKDGTCDFKATFLPPDVSDTVLPNNGTDCAEDTQRSALIIPAAATGNVASIDDSVLATGCPTGYTCFGNQAVASVKLGATISPYLTWQIFYATSVLNGLTPSKVAFVHDGTVIQAGKKGACANANSTNCIDHYTPTADGVFFFIRTFSNGLIKGMR